MLGVAVGERGMLVAEVSNAAGERRYQVNRVGQFQYGEGQSLANPQALGQAFAQYLRMQGFTARRAVFGLPAKWVLSKPKEVLAADAATIASMLRLQAETEFSPELKDLVYDYAGQTSASEASTVLLAATPRKHVDELTAIAEAAKLTPVAVTTSIAALAAATGRVKRDAMVLSLNPSGAELGGQRGPTPAVLRHMGPASAVASPQLMGELRRAATASISSNGHGGVNGMGANGSSPSANGHGKRELVLWDDNDTLGGSNGNGESAGLTACRAVGEAAGLSVSSGEWSALGVSAPVGQRGSALAVALALEGLQGALPVDFLHTRLAPPKEKKYDPRILWGSIAAAVVLLLVGGMMYDLYSQHAKLDALNAQNTKNADRVKAAQAYVDRVNFANDWRSLRPHFLECLRDLTAIMPDDGQTFVNTLTLHDALSKLGNSKGGLSGKSSNGASVIALIGKLNGSSHFDDVDLLDERENKGEVTFTISFVYWPGGRPAVGTPEAAAAASPSRAPARGAARTSGASPVGGRK
jgi:hypothetical protein